MNNTIVAKYYLNSILADDRTDKGGISFIGETLNDFLEENQMDRETPMEVVNKALVDCGIKPISVSNLHQKYIDEYSRLSERWDDADSDFLKNYFRMCNEHFNTSVIHIWNCLYFADVVNEDGKQIIDNNSINGIVINLKWFNSLSAKDKSLLVDSIKWQKLPLPEYM